MADKEDGTEKQLAKSMAEAHVSSGAEEQVGITAGSGKAGLGALAELLAEERERSRQARQELDSLRVSTRTQIEGLSRELEETKRKAGEGDSSLVTFLTAENTRLLDEHEATRLALTDHQAQSQALRRELTRVQEQSEEGVLQLNTMRGQMEQLSTRVKKAEADLEERTQEADMFKALLESEKNESERARQAARQSQSAAKPMREKRAEHVGAKWLQCC